jgi:hypothetical protein
MMAAQTPPPELVPGAVPPPAPPPRPPPGTAAAIAAAGAAAATAAPAAAQAAKPEAPRLGFALALGSIGLGTLGLILYLVLKAQLSPPPAPEGVAPDSVPAVEVTG